MSQHPRTGLHYVVAIPGAPTFDQVRACYGALASRCPSVEVILQEAFPGRWDGTDDDRVLFLLWGFCPPPALPARRSRLALVLSEPLGPFDQMLPQHIDLVGDHWKALRRCAAVFLHTPQMVERMRRMCSTPAYLLPVGWDPVMGRPDHARPKAQQVLHWGSPAGRRLELLPRLSARLGEMFTEAGGVFGADLYERLQGVRAGLYVGHSAVKNVSTFRIWQALVTSAPLIAEGWDFWPLVSGEHYLELPMVTGGNVDLVADLIRLYVQHLDLGSLAQRAWQEVAPRFTIDRCMERYLLPASREIADAPRTG